jgi:hypothetical protein
VKAWWRDVVQKRGHTRKAMASLAMLVNWEIWKERNACLFTNKSSTANMLILKIKEEVNLWSLARAKEICQGMTCKTSKNPLLNNEMANLLPCFKKK